MQNYKTFYRCITREGRISILKRDVLHYFSLQHFANSVLNSQYIKELTPTLLILVSKEEENYIHFIGYNPGYVLDQFSEQISKFVPEKLLPEIKQNFIKMLKTNDNKDTIETLRAKKQFLDKLQKAGIENLGYSDTDNTDIL